MALNINTIVQDADAFHAQARPLFVARWGACWQADPAARAEYAVPGQRAVRGQLAEGTSHPASGATKAGQFRELAVTDYLAFRHLRQGDVECRSADVCRVLGIVLVVTHVRVSLERGRRTVGSSRRQ
ncbi:hypothetical protein D3C85_963610 [compost metagenome]